MALCVRRLRGAQGLGRSGVRGAGVAAGRLRDGNRVRDVILFRELRPCPGISTAVRRPPTAIVLSTSSKPLGIRLSSPSSEQGRAVPQIKDILVQNKLPPKLLSQFLHHAEPSNSYPPDRERGHLSSAQLDCFRSLFEPGVCRTPYQALAFPTMVAQESLLKFTLSAKTAGGQATSSDQPSMEEHLAVMHEKLREELPKFLLKSPNATFYNKDIEFISTIFHLHLRGLLQYVLFLCVARLLLLCYYSGGHVSVLKLTTHPETNSIHARWSFTGLPLHCLFLYILKRDKTELYRTFDAFSIFQLGPDGRICLHKLERMMPSTPLTVSKKTILAAALLAIGLGDDRPALNLLLSTSKLPDKL